MLLRIIVYYVKVCTIVPSILLIKVSRCSESMGKGGTMKQPKKEIRFRVGLVTYDALKKLSRRTGYTMAHLVKCGLIDYLSKKGAYHD